MTLNKSLGNELYNLFGFNGSDQIVFSGETRRMIAFRELERHGLVELIERTKPEEKGFFDVKRVCRGLRIN